MVLSDSTDSRDPSTGPQSIPLQDLARPPDDSSCSPPTRGRSLVPSSSRRSSGQPFAQRYERLDDASPAPEGPSDRSIPSLKLKTQTPVHMDYGANVDSPGEFQTALGFAGLSRHEGPQTQATLLRSDSPLQSLDSEHPYALPSGEIGEEHIAYFPTGDFDRVPLTDPTYLQPVSGHEGSSSAEQAQDRSSFQSVRFNTSESKFNGSRLGDDLPGLEAGTGRTRAQSVGASLSPGGGSRARSSSLAVSPFYRAGSMVRAMSQRVVNLSNEAEAPPTPLRRNPSNHDALQTDIPGTSHSTSHGTLHGPSQPPDEQQTPYHPDILSPVEKAHAMNFTDPALPPHQMPNPLKGKSLGIFSADNPLRMKLCDILVHPVTEPTILILIIIQTILLALDSSKNVYTSPRPRNWGDSALDYAMLALFGVFTVEVISRIIVSGFIHNAPEYSTIDRTRGIRGAVSDKYRAIFAPQRSASVKKTRDPNSQDFAPSIMRTFTSNRSLNFDMPLTQEQLQRRQLARRAFLRHSFNRLDFVAVVAFWISFIMSIWGIESSKHVYVFKMLSCLRILRLLAITGGTSIILRSLKKSAPMLVNVSFLIGFFWLLFAIIGVQSFKASLRRQCVWYDPTGVQPSYTNDFQFCGGHLNNVTGKAEPWITASGKNGSTFHKGYLCPQNSLCVEGQAPYNGTVSFDNLMQSLELVFVIMSGNTFSDILYYTTNSDYLSAALFFAGGIVIMLFWLMNLLIAVITSSFQIIREESRTSAFTTDDNYLLPPKETGPVKRKSTIKMLYEKTFWFWICVIIFDLLTQAFRSATMSDDREHFIDNVEVIVTVILAFEMVLRFLSDYRNFFRIKHNWIDLILAIVTLVILIPGIRHSGQVYNWLTIFQILRIYRVVLAVPMTRKLITLVLGNAAGIGNLMLFVFLITFLMSILAVQLFRGDIPYQDSSGDTIQVTFFTLYNAFLGMYQIMSSENWTTLLYNIQTYDDHLNTAWIGALFFIGWFILANFILINMFIAVIQENFDVSEDEKRLQQVKAFLARRDLGSSSGNLALSTIFSFGRKKKRKDPLDYGPATMEMLLKDAVVKDFLDEEMNTSQLNAALADQEQNEPVSTAPDIKPGTLSSIWGKIVRRIWHREPNPFYSTINFAATSEGPGTDARAMAKEAVSAATQRKRAQREYLARHPRYNNALFIFSPTNPIRRLCQKIVGPGRGHERIDGVEPNKAVWYTFSAIIYASIVALVLLACVTTPLYQKEYFQNHKYTLQNWFVWTDMAFAIVFGIEALIKIIADGFFWTPNAYFRSSWGFIDGVVLVTLWINVSTSLANDGAISRAVGAFKALRALRLLNISDSARDTFHSVIIVGGWKVVSAAFVSLSLLIPFAIYGVNLFNGKMASCNDSGIVNLSDCSGEYNSSPFNWDVMAPRQSSNPYYDFDTFGGALFILFQIVSQEGWIDVMWSAQSITGKGMQPLDFASQGNAVFFVIFNLMSQVFILTLFISVFMRNYTEQTGVAYLTAEQRSWLELRKLLRQVSPSKRPNNKVQQIWRDWCYKRATKKHGTWHRINTIILVLHLCLLMLEYYPEPSWWERTRDYIFLAFTFFYISNIIVRIIGLSWTRFRRSSWDIFSLFAVFGTFATTVLLLSDFNSGIYVQLHKLFLVSITLLLIPRNDALDQLFKTAAASLTNIGNLLATWFVLFLVYAIALTQTFGLTRFGENEDNNVNFRTVPKALILLFRMSCGEGWNQVMEDFATLESPNCIASDNFFDSDCGSAAWARTLFISWNILSMYIFVNLFVSLIYESFSYVYQTSAGLSSVSRDEIRRFKQAWATVDPAGTGFISKETFPRLLGELSGVFAMRIYDENDSVRRILEEVRATTIPPVKVGNSTATISAAYNVDLEALNRRLAQIDSKKVRQRRHRYNLFFEEVMVSADPDRGISFAGVLMILAHWNIISDSKSLKLEEFLRRRARLQRVEEEVRRRVVIGFFDTMYWSRQFRRYLKRHDSARMTDIPQFAVPEIFVDESTTPFAQSKPTLSTTLSPRDTLTRWNTEPSAPSSPTLSPLNPFGSNDPMSPARSPQLSPNRATGSTMGSAFSFEDVSVGSASQPGSRRTSNVSAENVLEVLDNSAWGESIRRSFTMRRAERDSTTGDLR